jgi:hypothetical protein
LSLKNYVQEPESDVFQGMDSTSPVESVKPGFVVSAKNCYPGLAGGWVKRLGYITSLTSVWGTNSITGGQEFRDSAGNRKTVLFGTDGTGTGGALGYVNVTAVTSLTTGLDGSARPSFVQHGDRLLFFNGVDAPILYDGSGTRQVGITAPVSAPTVALGAGGSLNTSSNYIWAYTYYNSVTGAESSPSPLSLTTATGANTKGTLTLVAGSATTADTIRVYRTFANGTALFLDGTAVIGAVSYVSSIADTALSTTQIELDNTRITSLSTTAKFPIIARQRVFLKTSRNQIRYSKIGQSGPMPESFEALKFVTTVGKSGSNDDIVGISQAGDVPIVLKERSIGRLNEVGIQGQFSTDPVYFDYEELSTDVGAVSHWAATQVYGECVFLGKDNIYATRGEPGDLRPVANEFQATVKALGFSTSQSLRISAVNDQKLRLIYFAVFSTSAASAPDYVLVGDYRLYPKFRWSYYVPGTNTSTHPGVPAGCFIPVTNSTDGTQDIYFGNVASSGQLYKMNSGTTDNTKGIYFEVISRPYDMQQPVAVKLYKGPRVYAQGDGNAYNLSVSAIYDLSGDEEGSYSISLSSGGALWDNVNWDSATWSTNAAPIRRYPTHRKANHQQLVFRQTDASAPLTLFSWIPTGSIFRVF